MATLRQLYSSGPSVSPSPGAVALVAAALLGTWFAFAGWVIPQPEPARFNGYATGVAVAIVAANGFWFPTARLFNLALAVWIAFSAAWVFDLRGAPLWNASLVAVALFAVSLVPTNLRERPEGPGTRSS